MRVGDIRENLEAALRGLSEAERELLFKRADLTGNQIMRMELFMEGKNLNEIAGIDGITRESVNATLSAAQSKLKMARRTLG
jgi:DNA-binding CsgD family transcriptional regulator